MKSLVEQLAELERAAQALPAIQTEIKKIEASVRNVNQLLGGRPAAKRERPAKTVQKIRRRRAKTRVTLKGKVLAALAKGPMSPAQLKKVDGRAVAGTLDKWVSLGVLKRGPGGRYSKP